MSGNRLVCGNQLICLYICDDIVSFCFSDCEVNWPFIAWLVQSVIMEVDFLSHQCWSSVNFFPELLGWEWPKGTSVNVVVCAIKSCM